MGLRLGLGLREKWKERERVGGGDSLCFIAWGAMQMRLFLETIENHSRVIEM